MLQLWEAYQFPTGSCWRQKLEVVQLLKDVAPEKNQKCQSWPLVRIMIKQNKHIQIPTVTVVHTLFTLRPWISPELSRCIGSCSKISLVETSMTGEDGAILLEGMHPCVVFGLQHHKVTSICQESRQSQHASVWRKTAGNCTVDCLEGSLAQPIEFVKDRSDTRNEVVWEAQTVDDKSF